MRRLTHLGSLVLLFVLAGHTAFAQRTSPRQQTNSFGAYVTERASGTIKPVHLGSYYVGFDLAFARYLNLLGRKQDSREYIKLLSIALPEDDKEQIQSCLRMLAGGEGTVDQIDHLLKKVELSLEAKLKGEPRWFYDLGKTYAQFFMTLDYFRHTGDVGPFRQILIKLGEMAKTAPSDAPNEVVSSLVSLGKIGAKDQVNVDDVALIKESVTKIDTAMVV